MNTTGPTFETAPTADPSTTPAAVEAGTVPAPGDGQGAQGEAASARRETGYQQRLNQLRAAVLGANDGIVSVAATVVGVAGATTATGPVLAAGAAALAGGAVSMALGEYVSVSSQSDSENAKIAAAKRELEQDETAARKELAAHWQEQGLTPETAEQVATELHRRNALGARLSIEGDIDPDDIVSPWHAAIASFLAFFVGALLPLAAILLPPPDLRIPVTFASTLLALALTGWIAAKVGEANPVRASLRVVIGGALALGITFAIGSLLGQTGLNI